MKIYDVCIVGGGASALACATAIKKENSNIEVLLLEKNDRLGKKIFATGNGRCNLSNNHATSFGKTARFFRELGIEIYTDSEGRAYPVSNQSSDIVGAFSDFLYANGVDIRLDTYVADIQKQSNEKSKSESKGEAKSCLFFVMAKNGKKFCAKKLVIAMGGKAGSQFGTCGEGYKIAKSLGHTITRLAPGLSPIECECVDASKVSNISNISKASNISNISNISNVSNVRAKAEATLYKNNEPIKTERGEVQFTEYGLSGICIFNLSGHIKLDENTQFEDYHITLDLLPDHNYEEIIYLLKKRQSIRYLEADRLLRGLVNEKLATEIISYACGMPSNEEKTKAREKKASELTADEIKKVAYELKNLTYEVKNVRGWQYAQTTVGGVCASEIDEATMQSKKVEGLYFIGEMTEYAGACGGYNLENAWETARIAGKAICTEFTK